MAKRTKNFYDPKATKPYKLSRSGLDLFLECPKCFYLDKRLGVGRPRGFPFTLNSAVDALLKIEFDVYRAKGEAHPLMKANGVKAIPFKHKDLNKWRENFVGVQYLHASTNLLMTGAVDDVWVNPKEELIVVDYKATAKSDEVTELNEGWHDGYKRQMDVYQWLLRQNGFKVSSTGYWVYANGDKSQKAFNAELRFRMTLISYKGNDEWVEPAIKKAKKCLDLDSIPKSGAECEYCSYVATVEAATL